MEKPFYFLMLFGGILSISSYPMNNEDENKGYHGDSQDRRRHQPVERSLKTQVDFSPFLERGKLFKLLDKRHHIARKNFSMDLKDQVKSRKCNCEHSIQSKSKLNDILKNAKCSQCNNDNEHLMDTSLGETTDFSDRDKRNYIERNDISANEQPRRKTYTFENDLVNRFISFICGKGC